MPNIGDPAPNFQGQDQNAKVWQLADFKGKTLILYFYPKDDTPGCTKQACDLRDNYQSLLDKGLAVLGVSPDGADSHGRFVEKYDLPFPLLADEEKVILKAYGAWGMKQNYGRSYEGVLRTTFIIGPDARILKVFKRPDTKAHSHQILKALGLLDV